ncbi:MAG: molecular chaperone TorD family protein [Pseudomonadota bacterium]
MLRAQLYLLLARYLDGPPTQASLATAAALVGDDAPLGRAINSLVTTARASDLDRLSEQYHELFVGLGRGQLVPFGSYYLTGFLNEKPLARLRQVMAERGIAREDGVAEPEDHIASLAEMMAGFITGGFGAPMSLAEQKLFYAEHIGSWAPHFFRDLAGNAISPFYAALGAVGQAFLNIEERAFRMI